MKFEKINYGSNNLKKGIIIGFVLCALIFVVINLFFTRAKYKLVESRKLASGTVNYTLVDFELAGIKVKKDGSEDYEDVDTIEDNYELNQEMSYCTEKYTNENNSFEDVRNDNLTIEFNKDTKTISVKPYSKKGTKCYLFFDEHNPSEDTLANMGITQTKGTVDGFTGTSCNSGCDLQENGIYEAEDDFGTSYYYRGTVDNNWVVFGKEGSYYIWWRIIRINGNGSIRLIYAGTNSNTTHAPLTTGDGTMIKPKTQLNSDGSYPRAVTFNTINTDNKYVGYMYPGGAGASTSFDNAHKVNSNSVKSDVLTEIGLWYNQNTNLGTLADKYIDVDTGFCSDSTISTINHGSPWQGIGEGYGNQATAYAGVDRVWQSESQAILNSQTPTLKCGYTVSTQSTDTTARKRDLYTGPNATKGGTKGLSENIEGNNALPVPVGLITMDETIYAGGFWGKGNRAYWLYNNSYYWTITPLYFFYLYSSSGQNARVFYVQDDGATSGTNVSHYAVGVRPVINLKIGTKFTFNDNETAGTTTNPYIVETS